MIQPLTLTFGLTLLFSLATATEASAQRRDRGARRVELEHLVYQNEKFESKALDGPVRFNVFLPKDYGDEAKREKRYPTIYFLHGMWEDCDRFYKRGGGRVLDDLVGAGSLPDVIFVCVNDRSRGSFYINTKRAKVEDMILEDLIPHVEKTFRTAKGRDQRVLLGISMGGYGALKIAFKNPKLFGIVATHSAAILPEKVEDLLTAFPWAKRYEDRLITPVFGKPVDKKLWRAENPLALARKLDPESSAGMKLYFDCGDADRYGFQAPNRALHEVLTKRKIPHAWRLVKGGNHGWRPRGGQPGYNQTALPFSLRFIASALKQKQGVRGLSGLLGGKGERKAPEKVP